MRTWLNSSIVITVVVVDDDDDDDVVRTVHDIKWNLFNQLITHYGPGVDSASNRNEYQVYFLGVKAAGE